MVALDLNPIHSLAELVEERLFLQQRINLNSRETRRTRWIQTLKSEDPHILQ